MGREEEKQGKKKTRRKTKLQSDGDFWYFSSWGVKEKVFYRKEKFNVNEGKNGLLMSSENVSENFKVLQAAHSSSRINFPRNLILRLFENFVIISSFFLQ